MVDTTKATESTYVNAQLVKESPTKRIVIIEEGAFVESEFNGVKKEKYETTVQIDGKTKKYSPNQDTMKNIQNMYGKNSSKWVGVVLMVAVGSFKGKETVNGFPIPPTQ